MAERNKVPVADPLRGVAALERDLPRVLEALGQSSLHDAGWRRLDKLDLVVPVTGISSNGQRDDYLLRLGFHCYHEWPPSAQFVNPETLRYEYPGDQHHLPQVSNAECHVHPNYQDSSRGQRAPRFLQLICCSATLEFYDVLHSVHDRHVWDQSRDTFLVTINAIQAALRSPQYSGRWPQVQP